jgi:3-methyladenine DNA glycosylase AlkD
MVSDEITRELIRLSNSADAQFLQGFFKTGPGQYGQGDRFRGIRVPVLRKLCKAYQNLPIEEVKRLLHSAYHEDRLLALFILIRSYEVADERGRGRIYRFYLANARFINNWDLVDASAPHIVGAYLRGRSRVPLYKLAQSRGLWKRRIAVLATFHFIKQKEFSDALKIAEILLRDKEDLIHKAVGWMLREIGKRDGKTLEAFLNEQYQLMPRTMLRYAIERFPEERRLGYLKGTLQTMISTS